MIQYRPTTVTVDLDAIRHNVRLVRQAIGLDTALMAVVKANAYGHGLLPAASAAVEAGASWLGVALAEEGERLRNAGFSVPILVLGGVTVKGAAASVANGLTQTVCNPADIIQLQNAGLNLGKSVNIHIKIDTGMGRIGARNASELKDILSALSEAPNVHMTGAYTHFADADSGNPEYTYKQFEMFKALVRTLPGGLLLHSANSAAALCYPDTRLDMVRTGIVIYGCPPVKTELPFRPAMRITTRIAYVKEIASGDNISYGLTFSAKQPMRVATLPIGYGDGYHRCASEKASVLIRGTLCKVLGRICMDQMMVDVSHLASVSCDEEVVLMGSQGRESITADMIGEWCGTISYEILLSATSRVQKNYISLYN